MEIGHTFYSWSTFIVMEAGFLHYVLSSACISWYIFRTLFTIFRPIKSTLYSVFYPCNLITKKQPHFKYAISAMQPTYHKSLERRGLGYHSAMTMTKTPTEPNTKSKTKTEESFQEESVIVYPWTMSIGHSYSVSRWHNVRDFGIGNP